MEQERQELYCPVVAKCGSCQGFACTYEKHLKNKGRQLSKLLSGFCSVEPCIGMEEPLYYRHKVHAVYGEDKKHNIICGTYEENSHRIVSVEGCLLEHRQAGEIMVTIKELLRSFKIKPFNEDTGYGFFRHVLIRCGYHSKEIMVVLVVASPVFPSKKNFVKALLKCHPNITTVCLNVNPKKTSMVLGEKEEVLYGKGYITDSLCGKNFKISPKSFYQVNPYQTEKLYRKAMEFADFTGEEMVCDAYCGTGTIGIIASDYVKEVIGVELNLQAVADAKINAKTNEVKNIRFVGQDAGKFMESYQGKVDVVLMDPPRSGSDRTFLASLVRLGPEKIVYISCNPQTLARDLKYLTANGYDAKKAVGVDMFPWTDNLEAVVILHKNSANYTSGIIDSTSEKLYSNSVQNKRKQTSKNKEQKNGIKQKTSNRNERNFAGGNANQRLRNKRDQRDVR